MATTARLALRYPTSADTADVPRDIGNLASDIDNAAVFGKGLFANRPTSTVGSPGVDGRYYYATDTSRLYLDTGTAWIEVATNGTIDNAIPIGSVQSYAGSTAPTNWLLCEGQAVSRSTYQDLFTALSTTYGSGDGSTTFNLPDLRGRVTVGKGTNADVDTLGENDGVAVASRTPKHYHSLTTGRGGQFASHENSGATGNSSFFTTSTATTGQRLFATTVNGMVTSGNSSNANTPSFIVLNSIIRAL